MFEGPAALVSQPMKRVLLVALLLIHAAPVRADDTLPRDADAWCTAHPGEILVRDAARIWHRIADNHPRTDDEGRMQEAWTGDLEGDGRADLVLHHLGGCGSRECPFEAFVACSDGMYSSVMPAAYGDKVRVTRERKRGWSRIEMRSVGESKVPRERYLWSGLRFGAAGYQ